VPSRREVRGLCRPGQFQDQQRQRLHDAFMSVPRPTVNRRRFRHVSAFRLSESGHIAAYDVGDGVRRKPGRPVRDGAGVSSNDDEPQMTVAQQAAEHARRLLNRPGLLHAVRVAQAIRQPERPRDPAARAGQVGTTG
jgi:hypothetical protein